MRILLLGLIFLAACTSPSNDSEPADAETDASSAESAPEDSEEQADSPPEAAETPLPDSQASDSASQPESALSCSDPFGDQQLFFNARIWLATDFCKHSVDYGEIFSGGVPPDGIPAIDDPVFESVEAADEWLQDEWPVMLFEANGEARAYPLAILIWHEIVNDEVGGQPVTLTFCPLCNSTIAFNPILDDGTQLDFGVSGNLRNADLIMYDRQTHSWWQQFTGEGIVGEYTGTTLEMLPSQIISWADFKRDHSDSLVLSRQTGHLRSYGTNPYGGYDDINSSPFFPVGKYGDELPPVERVVALTIGDLDVAFPFSLLSEVGVVNEEYAGEPIAVFWQSGTNSTFGNALNDVGSSGAFSRRLDDQILTFEPWEEGFIDVETGSVWTLAGEAIEGPLAGSQLERLVFGEHFWFAWSVFRPGTIVWQP